MFFLHFIYIDQFNICNQFQSEESLKFDHSLHQIFEHVWQIKQKHHRHCNQCLVLIPLFYLYYCAVLQGQSDNETTGKLTNHILNYFCRIYCLLIAWITNKSLLRLIVSLLCLTENVDNLSSLDNLIENFDEVVLIWGTTSYQSLLRLPEEVKHKVIVNNDDSGNYCYDIERGLDKHQSCE